MRKLVIIPTYNEKENISAMIDKVFSLPEPFDMLVIDDGSPDGTAAIVKERRKEFPGRLHLMERAGKLGLGTAYLAGFRWGLENGFDYICEMDCDFSHNPDDLVRLYRAAAEGYDVVVGSRYVQGVNVVNWPMSRLLMSYFASMYVRIVTRMPLRDATAGFVCYSRRALETIDLDAIRMKGYGFQIEMKYSAWRLGMAWVEVSDHLRRAPRGNVEKCREESSGRHSSGVLKLLRRIRKRHDAGPEARPGQTEEIIHKEIPERQHADGKEFRQVEIQAEIVQGTLMVALLDHQPDSRDAQEPRYWPVMFGISFWNVQTRLRM